MHMTHSMHNLFFVLGNMTGKGFEMVSNYRILSSTHLLVQEGTYFEELQYQS